MRALLWSNVSHVAAAFVLLAFWGVFRLTRATGGKYAKPKGLALVMGSLWLAVLIAATYLLPGFGLFAASMAVTLLADNHQYASLARRIGIERFHERMTEILRQEGAAGFLRVVLPTQLLHLAFALTVVALTAGPQDWIYWVALGFAAAHVLRIISLFVTASKYRKLRDGSEEPRP